MLRIALLFLALPVFAAEPILAVRCGRLLDVRAGTYTANAVVLVQGNRFVDAGPASRVAVPAGATVIDQSANTCLPGLMDVHAHLTSDATTPAYERLGISVPRAALTGARNARVTLEAGFTTVRNVGAPAFSDVALRDAIEAGDIPGPRMLVSGPSFGITGGHCDDNLLAPEYPRSMEGVADGPWAAKAKVRENRKYGADLIKVCASGGVMSKNTQPGTPQYSVEELTAVVEEAHKLGMKVAAHAHGTQSIKDAIRSGVDSVEHCSFIDDEGIRLARERGTYLVFDIYNDTYILEMGAKVGMLPESIEKERIVGQTQRDNFRKAWQGGVKMAFGTDGGVYPHGDNWRQFPYMVEYGMKPMEAIRAATVEAAALLGVSDRLGTVEKGKVADLIAVPGDPLTNVGAFERVAFVMKDGKVVRR